MSEKPAVTRAGPERRPASSTIAAAAMSRVLAARQLEAPPASSPPPPPPVRVLCCTPVQYGQSYDRHWESLIALMQADSRFLIERAPGVSGCGVAKARNVHAGIFLRGQAEAMLTWDNDIEIGPKAMTRFLSNLFDPEVEVIGALYPLRTHPPSRWVLSTLPGEAADANGRLEVLECGTGLKLIRRAAFLRQIKAYPEIMYTADDSNERIHAWDFFSMGVVNGRYLSEDYYFDWRHRRAGGKVYVDTTVRARHLGQWTFDGRGLPIPGTGEIHEPKLVQAP